MNRELLESISDLTYAQARFFTRSSPFHLQRQFMSLQDRIVTLLTQFPARLPPAPTPTPAPTPAPRQLDIPVNLVEMLFGSNAYVGLGHNNQQRFWEAVVVGLTPEQFAAGTQDYSNPPDIAEQDQCCICQEGITTEAAIHTLCPGLPLGGGVTSTNHHALHRRCAQTWFAISTRCPVCRADLRTLNTTTTNAGASASTSASAPGGEPSPASSGSVHSNV
jgi:hypothetical protein